MYKFGNKFVFENLLELINKKVNKSDNLINDILEDNKVVLEIKNKLNVGDKIEIIVPNQIETVNFEIEKLWDIETDEEIETINPGRAEQKVKIKLPIKVEKGYILRRVK